MLEQKATTPRNSRVFPWRWITSLASLAVAAAAVTWLAVAQSREDGGHHPPPRSSETVVSTQIGERGSVDLPDGTRLVLNTASRVRADRVSHRITVEQGEVIADVPAPSSEHEYSNVPVVIDAGGVGIETASAARLRIRMDENGVVQVDVLAGDGVYRLMSPHQVVDLVAGQTALIRPGDVVDVSEFEPSRMQRALSWQEGEVCLNGQTLQEAVAEFNRYNRQKLVVLDGQLAQRRMGGRFETTDVEGFVDALRHLYGVRVLAVRSGGKGASTLVLLPAEQEA